MTSASPVSPDDSESSSFNIPELSINDPVHKILDHPQTTIFQGMSMSLSGKFPPLTQQQMRTLLRKHGAQVSATPRKKTQYIVCGEKCATAFPEWCICVNKEWVFDCIDNEQIMETKEGDQYVVPVNISMTIASTMESSSQPPQTSLKRKKHVHHAERVGSLLKIEASELDKLFKFPGNQQDVVNPEAIDYQKRVMHVVPYSHRMRYADPYADLGDSEVYFSDYHSWSEMYCRMCVRENHLERSDPDKSIFHQPAFLTKEVYDEYYLLQILVFLEGGIPKYYIVHNRWGIVGQGHTGVWQKAFKTDAEAINFYKQIHFKLTDNDFLSSPFVPKKNCFVPLSFEIPFDLMEKRRAEERKRINEMRDEVNVNKDNEEKTEEKDQLNEQQGNQKEEQNQIDQEKQSSNENEGISNETQQNEQNQTKEDEQTTKDVTIDEPMSDTPIEDKSENKSKEQAPSEENNQNEISQTPIITEESNATVENAEQEKLASTPEDEGEMVIHEENDER